MRALSHPLIFQRNQRGPDKILKLIDIQVESGIFSCKLWTCKFEKEVSVDTIPINKYKVIHLYKYLHDSLSYVATYILLLGIT